MVFTKVFQAPFYLLPLFFSALPSSAMLIDFETDDGGKTLVNGQVIATDPGFPGEAQPGDTLEEFGNSDFTRPRAPFWRGDFRLGPQRAESEFGEPGYVGRLGQYSSSAEK